MLKEASLDELFKDHDVSIAYLFGSQKDKGIAFMKGQSIEIERGSDLDIGVVFKDFPSPEQRFDLYINLYAGLSEIFNPFNIDLVFLQETDSLFQYEAIKGELVYCEDEGFLDRYEELVMKKAEDLSFKRIEFERDFLEAIRDGYIEIKHK